MQAMNMNHSRPQAPVFGAHSTHITRNTNGCVPTRATETAAEQRERPCTPACWGALSRCYRFLCNFRKSISVSSCNLVVCFHVPPSVFLVIGQISMESLQACNVSPTSSYCVSNPCFSSLASAQALTQLDLSQDPRPTPWCRSQYPAQ